MAEEAELLSSGLNIYGAAKTAPGDPHCPRLSPAPKENQR